MSRIGSQCSDSLELVSKPCQARVLSANSPTASSGRQARSRETALRRAAGRPVRGHPLSVLKPVLNPLAASREKLNSSVR
jgi:hypothetical protein